MKRTLLTTSDIETLNHHLFKNKVIGSRYYFPFVLIDVIIIILIIKNNSDNKVALIWSLLTLIFLIVSMVITIKLMNRKIKNDKVEMITTIIRGVVTKVDDRPSFKMVSRVATEIPNERACFIEVDNKEVYKVNSEDYKNIQTEDNVSIKFAKNSKLFLSITKE